MTISSTERLMTVMGELQYPRKIALDSFTKPNFELVAEILYWLVSRYMYGDSASSFGSVGSNLLSASHSLQGDVPIHQDLTSENDRVKFINSIVYATSCHFRGYDPSADDNTHKNMQGSGLNVCLTLSGKKLYAADERAVDELLKLADYLRCAVEHVRKTRNRNDGICVLKESQSDESARRDVNTTTRLVEAAQSIVDEGEDLLALIHEEGTKMKNDRDQIMNYVSKMRADSMKSGKEHQMLQNALTNKLSQMKNELSIQQQGLRHKNDEVRDLATAIEHHEGEKRSLKLRLQQLGRNIGGASSIPTPTSKERLQRPEFWNAYEALEQEHGELYDAWVKEHKNITFLKKELGLRRKYSAQLIAKGQKNALQDFRQKHSEQERHLFSGMFQQAELANTAEKNN